MSGLLEVEDLDVHAFLAQVRADVEKPQRRVRLHDLKFLRILVQEISVS